MCFASKPFFKQNEMSTIRPFPELATPNGLARHSPWVSVGLVLDQLSYTASILRTELLPLQTCSLQSSVLNALDPTWRQKTPCWDWWIAATRHEKHPCRSYLHKKMIENERFFSASRKLFTPVSKATEPRHHECQTSRSSCLPLWPLRPATDSAGYRPSSCLCSKLIKRCLIHTSSRAWLKRQEAK